ncbi:PAN domain-containing protein [Jannaschia sp. LMIT008]|uniref:PAN domain-containing protein n=1 Tax=Jannaschia maritima TaxID=3032585 RepID=UPI0028127613|nr:PAN domain-containing protein [Jannaschia sp. LMIT008]
MRHLLRCLSILLLTLPARAEQPLRGDLFAPPEMTAEWGCTIPGMDYHWQTLFPAPTVGAATQCRQLCMRDRDCAAYSVTRAGSRPGPGRRYAVCYLKDHRALRRPSVADPDVVSGRKIRISRVLHQTDLPGNDLPVSPISYARRSHSEAVHLCRSMCARRTTLYGYRRADTCGAFTVTERNACWLKGSGLPIGAYLRTRRAAGGMTSGVITTFVAMEAPLPGGSYVRTCAACRSTGTQLRCRCHDGSRWKDTSVRLDGPCRGRSITNRNGALRCD